MLLHSHRKGQWASCKGGLTSEFTQSYRAHAPSRTERTILKHNALAKSDTLSSASRRSQQEVLELRDKAQNRAASGATAHQSTAVLVAALLLVAAYLYLNLFALPRTPILLSGDQTYFWMDAQRMMFGELPYRDFFQFTPPGTDVVYFALFTLFGPQIWVTNALVLVLGMALCWACFSISQQIMSRWPALLAATLFLTLVYGKPLNATHHWFSVLLIMCAVRVAIAGLSTPRIVLVGMLLGLAAFFTQTHAAVGLLAFVVLVILQWQRERQSSPVFVLRLTVLVAGFVLTAVICEWHFLSTLGASLIWYYQFTFVHRYMVHGVEGAFLGLPETRFPEVLQYLVVYALLLVVYPLSLWRCWAHRHDEDHRLWANLTLLSVLGSLLAIEVAFSLNWLRVFVVSMPGFVLTVFWLEQSRRAVRYVMKFAWVAVVILALLQTWTRQHRHYVVANLPAGRTALSAENYEKFDWIKQHTHPGEFFFEALVPSTYLPLGLRSPVFAEGMTRLPQTRPEFVQRTIREMEAKPTRYVLWSHYLNEPGPVSNTPDPLVPFRNYLADKYPQVQTFTDGDEIWEKKGVGSQ
jgi:hypothetical protein